MQLMVDNPNLSVILPVNCNAKCKYCYWNPEKGLTPDRFEQIAKTLPADVFSQVSITGGEPTLSSDLITYLTIARKYFKKVVLNTNGYKLTAEHLALVDYVNISRHHYNDLENQQVFLTSTIPTLASLSALNMTKVTFNCVLPDGFNDTVFIDNYINHIKPLKARVAFRKYFSNLNLLPIDLDDTLINDHGCPACRHREHIINDTHVTYKYAVQETCEAIQGIYELVLQANGDLTVDWAGKLKLQYKEQ